MFSRTLGLRSLINKQRKDFIKIFPISSFGVGWSVRALLCLDFSEAVLSFSLGAGPPPPADAADLSVQVLVNRQPWTGGDGCGHSLGGA